MIRRLSNNLLGLPAITALDILTKVDAIHSRENVILKIFKSVPRTGQDAM